MKPTDYVKIIRYIDVNGREHQDNLNIGAIVKIVEVSKSKDSRFPYYCSDGTNRNSSEIRLLSEWEEEHENIKLINNNKMKITNLIKKILDADTRKLVEAGFINGDLALTDEGVSELLGIMFLEKKAELVKIAQEQIDNKKTK